jgi:hypothetical protein
MPRARVMASRVALAIWVAMLPTVVSAQQGPPLVPQGVPQAITECLARRFGPNYSVSMKDFDSWIFVNDELTYSIHREVPYQRRGVQDRKVGGDEVPWWFDNDPLSPPVVFKYSVALRPDERRDITNDWMFFLGLACFSEVYKPQ